MSLFIGSSPSTTKPILQFLLKLDRATLLVNKVAVITFTQNFPRDRIWTEIGTGLFKVYTETYCCVHIIVEFCSLNYKRRRVTCMYACISMF